MTVYVHAILKLKIGSYDRFCAAMATQVGILEQHGWKLIGGYTTAIGSVCTIIDLWELEDANAFFEANAKWRAHPEFAAFRAVTSEAVLEESISMVTKVPYSP